MKETMVFFEKCLRTPQNPPDDSTPKCFEKKKKKPLERIIPHFPSKVQNLTSFFNYLHVSNPTFRAAGVNTETFFG